MSGHYRYSFLTKEHYPRIYQTFKEAFADYYLDMSYLTEELLFNRAIKNGVEYESSVGVFDGDKMVGFTLVGIDYWENVLSAFDAGTGIIPGYRGKGIAKQMFEFSLPGLKKRGVNKFLLEVLQENEQAVKAYRKTGFKITREFDCFELTLKDAILDMNTDNKIPLEIQKVTKKHLEVFKEHVDWHPSWENSFSSIARIPDNDEVVMYGAFIENKCVGLLVYYPFLNWIMSLVVKKAYRRKGIATRLIAHFINSFTYDQSNVKLVNVDRSDSGMLKFLEGIGFKVYTRQFEMEFVF